MHKFAPDQYKVVVLSRPLMFKDSHSAHYCFHGPDAAHCFSTLHKVGVVYLKTPPDIGVIPWVSVLPIGTVRHLVDIPSHTQKTLAFLWYTLATGALYHTPLFSLVFVVSSASCLHA